MLEKKGKKRWIIISIVAVVVVGLIIGIVAINSSSSASQQTAGTVEKITKRTIANSISGSGVIEATDRQDVTGGSFGMTVATVNVEVGDVVAKGDIICVFDTEAIDEQIADLQKQIEDAEANRATQNAEFDQQMVNADADRAEDLAKAKENLAEAQTDLAEAEADLAARQAEYEEYLAAGNESTTLEAMQMESVIDTKKSTVQTIRMRVDSYQSQVDIYTEADNSNIENTKENYNNQVDSSIESLKDILERYQDQKADAVIRAGIAGTVTSLNVTEGTTFSAGTIATIEGVDTFIIEAQIEEYDIPDIELGMKVLIKTDATRDEELEGVVTYIAPRATNSGSSTSSLSSLMSGIDTSSLIGSSSTSATYLVKIELKEQNDRLRLGMNAKTSIITEERVDVWSVPYDAVYTREDGTAYLERVDGKDEDGNLITTELDVQIGIQGTYYVEVISDLINENTEILVPDAQGSSSIEELLNMMGADAGI